MSGGRRAEAASNGRSARYLIFMDVPFPESDDMRERGGVILRLADSKLHDAGEHARDQLPERTLAKMPEGHE